MFLVLKKKKLLVHNHFNKLIFTFFQIKITSKVVHGKKKFSYNSQNIIQIRKIIECSWYLNSKFGDL